MKNYTWVLRHLLLLLILLITACGSDVEMDQNLDDPRNVSGQNDGNSDDDDSSDDDSSDDDSSDDDSSDDDSGDDDSSDDDSGDDDSGDDDSGDDDSGDDDSGNDNSSDDDGDGVLNETDQCPETPSGETVNEQGCSTSQTDTDGDGIYDDTDQCENTPSGEAADESGCSDSQKDSDADGISDTEDQCPDTPSGETVNEQGCSASQTDTDGDGIYDDADQCENTPSGEAVDESGCSDSQKDSDGDGVNDAEDQCADTPAGSEVNPQGCVEEARTYVPDDGFEQSLIDMGYDDVPDDYVLTENIASLEGLTLRGNRTSFGNGNEYGIKSLTGIEDFLSLKQLSLDGIWLDDLDLINQQNLEHLSLHEIKVANGYKISGLNKLKTLIINCQLPDEIAGNPLLTGIKGDEFTFAASTTHSLLIADNALLEEIIFFTSNLQNIQLRNNTQLKVFSAHTGYINSLTFENTPRIIILRAGFNGGFTQIDLSGLPLLEELYLDTGALETLDVSNNPALSKTDLRDNPHLYCIRVNPDQLSAIPPDWNKDIQAEYKLECN
ncbi:hypothetical protein [Robertkochia flava]|uniref:hypothetical protein n=1 Tax=Robertkochia flava TaxID=3447986 RepID=UPI001CCAD034|nr:hypothetical protein [Robertkochia marina]